jgi:hypothetical protein
MTNSPLLPLERWKSFTRKIPYGPVKNGFKVNPDNPLELIPNEEAIAWFEQGFDFVANGNSLREVSEWLSQKLKKTVSHQTVNNLYNTYRKPYTFKKTKKRVGPKRTKESIQKTVLKVAATKAIKKIEEFEQKQLEKKKQLQPTDYNVPLAPKEKKEAPVFEGAPAAVNILFKPNPGPQRAFLGAKEKQVLYGGAAGGGKSYAMLMDPTRWFGHPKFAGLLLRRTNDELRELVRESKLIYPKAFPGAVFREKDSMWVFPSGATFWMSYLDRDDDVLRYQGQSFAWIGVDELTQYPTPFAWNYLFSRLRSSDPELDENAVMRATTNPGGPGHHWVKKMFVDPAPAGEAFWAVDIESGETLWDDEADEPLLKRRFIPAKLSDNPHLAKSGNYRKTLLSLPADLRRKLLDGDWNVMEGAAFAEFNPKHHVCTPFDIPDSWRRFRCADYGYSSPSAVLWIAIDPQYETLYVYRELYEKGLTAQALAAKVLDKESHEKISYGILDSSVWHQRGHNGPSIAEEMIQNGCRWRPADRGQGSRAAGKNRLHELLRVKDYEDGTERPGLIIFENCRQLIADLPSLPTDPDGGDDIDDRSTNDHTYDALRYGVMSRPRSGSPLDWGSKPRDVYVPSDRVFGY